MKNSIIKSVYLYVLALIVLSCEESTRYVTPQKEFVAQKAAVVAAHPEATEIGVAILRRGGNAVDAAIAVQFALAVCLPTAGNIGGGGFMVYRANDGSVYALDYREKAPSLAHESMYLDSLGNPIEKLSLEGHLAAGVPGTVDGMWKAYQQFSKLKNWAALVQPAIDLAERGFTVTEQQANDFRRLKEDFIRINEGETIFTSKEWKAGDKMKQPELAKTLKSIRDQGRDGFYTGEVAELIVNEMERGNGLITKKDLLDYNSVWRTPVKFDYKGLEVVSMPPPSSGGILLAQLLKMTEMAQLHRYGFHSVDAIHLMVEMERLSYADRADYLGDPDFYNVPINQLIADDYLAERFKMIRHGVVNKSQDVKAGKINFESEETTHYCVVDEEGNAVSMTTTLNGSYGSKLVVKGAGFLLNNEMDDFSIKPGVPNLYGLIGSEANKIEPGKRMLSSMTPTIVSKDGKLIMVVGTPGGSTIITSVFQVITALTEFGLTPYQAVQSPRFHHQWLPDLIFVEADGFKSETIDSLKNMGYSFQERSSIGRVELIYIDNHGKKIAVADKRGDDHASGY